MPAFALLARVAPLVLLFLVGKTLTGCARTLPTPGTLAAGAASVEVPSRFHGEHVFIPVHIAGSEPIWLLLDTGASFSILDNATAARLDVSVSGASTTTGTGPEQVRGAVTEEVRLEPEGSEGYRVQIPVLDLSGLEPIFGAEIPGIAGGDLFWRYVVEIDYAAGRVILHDAERFRPRPEDARLALGTKYNIPYVRGSVVLPDGRSFEGRFDVDTGDNGTLKLYAPFVRDNRIIGALPHTIPGSTAGIGGETEVRHGRLAAFQLGPFTVDAPTATLSLATAGATASAERAGQIGAELLARFTVTFDYRRGALYLRPNERFAESFGGTRAAFALVAEGPDFRTYRIHSGSANSAAAHAGLLPGDLLVALDGSPTRGKTMPELRRLLRGEPGRRYTLTIERDGEALSLELLLDEGI